MAESSVSVVDSAALYNNFTFSAWTFTRLVDTFVDVHANESVCVADGNKSHFATGM
jgi:hypothetical protein